jgi:hypothetical protein
MNTQISSHNFLLAETKRVIRKNRKPSTLFVNWLSTRTCSDVRLYQVSRNSAVWTFLITTDNDTASRMPLAFEDFTVPSMYRFRCTEQKCALFIWRNVPTSTACIQSAGCRRWLARSSRQSTQFAVLTLKYSYLLYLSGAFVRFYLLYDLTRVCSW